MIKPIVNEIINHKPVRTIAEDIPFNKLGFGFTQMFANFNSQKKMIPLYKAIAILINIVVVITVFCGTWIGMWSLIDHIIDTKSISERATVGMLSESARIKMQEFRKKLNDSIQKESTPKH